MPPPPPRTDGSKKSMSNRVNKGHLARNCRSSKTPDREASLIKKEYCRLSASPHSLQVTPSRARPYLEGRAG